MDPGLPLLVISVSKNGVEHFDLTMKREASWTDWLQNRSHTWAQEAIMLCWVIFRCYFQFAPVFKTGSKVPELCGKGQEFKKTNDVCHCHIAPLCGHPNGWSKQLPFLWYISNGISPEDSQETSWRSWRQTCQGLRLPTTSVVFQNLTTSPQGC